MEYNLFIYLFYICNICDLIN